MSKAEILLNGIILDNNKQERWQIIKKTVQPAKTLGKVLKQKVCVPNIVGFKYDSPNFLIGYGLDYKSKFREFTCIFGGILKNEKN
jgi:hypoxanthine-guanine phosphoribosyltransferase